MTEAALAAALEGLLSRKREEQALFGNPVNSDDASARMDYFRTSALGAIVEMVEVLNEAGWKPWKQQGFGEIADPTAFAEEVADVVMFVLNVCCVAGVSGDELARAIEAVFAKNERRHNEGY